MQTTILAKTDSLAGAFQPPRGITAIVGGGGKTTLMLCLARELYAGGARVIVTTTTHIFPPEGITMFTGATMDALETVLNQERLLCLGTPAEHSKLAAPQIEIAKLSSLADYVLVEADGARHMPLKAPAEHEPVIPAQTALVIAVAGLDGVGKTIQEAVFRPERYGALLGKSTGETVCASDIARVLTHESGQHKGVLPNMRYCVLLNKADDEARLLVAREIANLLNPAILERVVIAALGVQEK